MENNKEFLPIGSIIRLKGATKNLMITGYLSIVPETREEYDYCACLWPIGYLDAKSLYLFNKDAIEQVIHVGYVDEEQKEFHDNLLKLSEEMDRKMENEKKKEETNVNTSNLE